MRAEPMVADSIVWAKLAAEGAAITSRKLGGESGVNLLRPACGEKVGMRGPLRSAQNSGNAPSPSLGLLARLSRAARGEMKSSSPRALGTTGKDRLCPIH